MTQLTKFALGDSACAVQLVDILNKLGNDMVSRKVSRYLANNNVMCKALIDMENPSVRSAFAFMLRREMVNPTMQVPEHIKTRAINVAVTHWKRAMEQAREIDMYERGIDTYSYEFDFGDQE